MEGLSLDLLHFKKKITRGYLQQGLGSDGLQREGHSVTGDRCIIVME